MNIGDWLEAKGKAVAGVGLDAIKSIIPGPIDDVVIESLKRHVLGTEAATEDELATVIATGSPEIIANIKLALIDAGLKRDRMELDRQRMELDAQQRELATITDDRQNARAMRREQISTGRTDTDPVLVVLLTAFFVCFGAIACMAILMEEAPDAVFVGMLGTLMGALVSYLKQGMDFKWGSSLGSKSKTDYLANGHKDKK